MATLNVCEVVQDLQRLREIEFCIESLLIEAKQIYQRIAPGEDEIMRAHLAAICLVP